MDCPNRSGWTKSFWSGPNSFGRVQTILVRFKLDVSRLICIIWTFQNDLDPAKTNLTRIMYLDGPKLFWTHRRTRQTKIDKSTGKSLSEALLFAEHGENMLCTKILLNVRNNFCTQHVLARFELGIFMYYVVGMSIEKM